MGSSITIDNLDDEVLERLRNEAKRRGVGVSAVISELIEESLAPVSQAGGKESRHDLDALAGTWSDEQAEAFLRAVADFGRVDEDMWK